MKVLKSGKVKCESGEVRIGNFFVGLESDGYIRFSDLSRIMVHRVSGATDVGTVLKACLERQDEEDARKWLEAYTVILWSLTVAVPVNNKDFSLFSSLLDVCNRNSEACKGVYGVKDNPSEEDEKKDLDEMREIAETEEDIREGLKEDLR